MADNDTAPATPTFFATPEAFRAWLADHHASAGELLVGFYKKGAGQPSITWPESVDQALCFGWIDGVRRRIDEHSYSIRFTPRRPGSVWSAVNIKRAQELAEQGLMQPAGAQAFAARQERRSGIYSYEQPSADLDEPYAQVFQQSPAAWEFFQAQPPSYRKAACWWVMSAKAEPTRRRRLEQLIAESAGGRRLAQFERRARPA